MSWIGLLVSAPVGQAATHSPQVTQRRGAHRVVEVERDAGRVALARAADDVVALDVVAGPDAAVAEDAGVVVDGDDRVGDVGAAAAAARQRPPTARRTPGELEQQVVAGRRLLRVVLGRRLVGDQQLGQGGAAALDLVRRGVVTSIPSSHGRTQDAARRGRRRRPRTSGTRRRGLAARRGRAPGCRCRRRGRRSRWWCPRRRDRGGRRWSRRRCGPRSAASAVAVTVHLSSWLSQPHAAHSAASSAGGRPCASRPRAAQ